MDDPYNKIQLQTEFIIFFFQAEDGIRDVERSRGLGDVYKRQNLHRQTKESVVRV